MSKTIYKKDSKGKLRVLIVKADGDDLVQTSGLDNGKLVEHRRTCKPKNVGRSNATTAFEQAVNEGHRLVIKKLKEGYFETITEALNVNVVLPMLAETYEKRAKYIDWSSAFVQPKLDGMRCLKTEYLLKSRKNREIDTMNHIAEQWTDLGTLDGELYAHGKSFQENMRLIKKYRPESEQVTYNVYDFISPLPFRLRYEMLKDAITKADSSIINLVPTYRVRNEEEVKEYHAKFLSEGYEGTMIRWGNEGYKVNGRSSSLLKYKDFKDIAITIKDVVPNDADPLHGSFIFDWIGAKGHPLGEDILGCGMKFSHIQREEILINKADYIGQIAELRFFETSDTGVPRFPVCVGIRLDK